MQTHCRAAAAFALLMFSHAAMARQADDVPPAGAMWVDSLDLARVTQGWQTAMRGKSVEGRPMTLGGKVYRHGIGTHAISEFRINLKRSAERFTSVVGVDDEKLGSKGSVIFEVWADGGLLTKSPVMRAGTPPLTLTADLAGKKTLVLRVGDAGDGLDSDHADWADAMLVLSSQPAGRPEAETVPIEKPRLRALATPTKPAIHGAMVVGATPGRPFLYRIPATGEPPLSFSAAGLPQGISLDANTGILSGALSAPGETKVTLTVRGPAGSSRRALVIRAGEHMLSQTPPMGWNSWNVWADHVDAAKVQASADAMIASGLAAHGFQYVNIDDTWEAKRDARGFIETNGKFPDMRALTDYIHGLGLKVGIYSSPGPQTCGGYEGSYQHEDQDARRWADWGMDYIKHDWCSYGSIAKGSTLEEFQKPYRTMRQSLDKVDRDIVYSLCQYGMGDVWKWGPEVGANCWRTTGDINDSWGSLHSILESQAGHEKFAGPGHWNDPDMLVVGQVGWGSPHPSHLTPNEQILHISMWCMLSSPLLIGCDMTKLDPFTLAILTNDEVIDINQDMLGRPASRVAEHGDAAVWARPLSDGTIAVALVNSSAEETKIECAWPEVGAKGRQPVRDLWLHRQAGSFEGSYSALVPAHGVVLVKIGSPRRM